jgi:hypothetical protein
MKTPFLSRATLLLAVIACAFVSRAGAQTTLLDTFTNAQTVTFTGGEPRTYMGHAFQNNSLPAGTTSFQVTSLTVYMVSVAAVNYTDILARIQLWNTYNGTTTPVYSNAAGPLITANLGPLNTTATTFYSFTINLATPITLVGGAGSTWGFAQNFQGNTGTGFADTTNLTSLITYGTAGYAAGNNATGTGPNFAYFRNASGRTDFNFASTDSRTLSQPNQGIAIQLRGTAVPEPATNVLLLMGAGVASLVAWQRRRRA